MVSPTKAIRGLQHLCNVAYAHNRAATCQSGSTMHETHKAMIERNVISAEGM